MGLEACSIYTSVEKWMFTSASGMTVPLREGERTRITAEGSRDSGSHDRYVPLLLELDHEIQQNYGQPLSL